MGKRIAKDKDENISIAKLLLTSGVYAAIIAGVFSLVTVCSTNKLTKEIEVMKYEYSLHQETYEEYERFSQKIIEAIEYDIKTKYILEYNG